MEKDQKLTLPVAPQHASLASSSTTLLPWLTSSLAAKVPVMPLPTTTTSASAGSWGVVRWPSSLLEGSLCQKEDVLCGEGRPDWPSWSLIPVMIFK